MPVNRTIPLVVHTPDSVPAIVNGNPIVPTYWPKSGSSVAAIVGPGHIEAIADPDPIWNPATGGWYTPPPVASPPFAARWTVYDLPDPSHFRGGYYWLGDHSTHDGTSGTSAPTVWKANGSTPGAPSWHSFFPYKPSVRAYDAYLPGGNVVHHPRGVHFNSHFIEHMWMDFGRSRPQPFTWVIAAMMASFPTPRYAHTILDAGRNPDAVHFPRLTASQTGTSRVIHDGLSYRNLIRASPSVETMSAAPGVTSLIRGRLDSSIRPKMYFGIFNGASSAVGCYDTGAKRITAGKVAKTSAQQHRFYVMGRDQGRISQDAASHMLVFEIRFYAKALTHTELTNIYNQLSSTYKFDRYRAL